MSKIKPTVEQIAELAGVSKATVSRVLNHSNLVSPEVRQKIKDIISDIGYVKKQTAVQIPLNFSTITVVSGNDITVPNSFYHTILESLRYESELLSIKLELVLFDQLLDLNGLAKSISIENPTIMIGIDNNHILELLKNMGVPLIIINGSDPEMKVSSISPDYEFGALLATNTLFAAGHKKIKFLTSNIKHSIYQRMDGFIRAFKLNEVKFDYSTNVIDIDEYVKNHALMDKNDLFLTNNYQGVDFGAKNILPDLIRLGYFNDCTAIFCVCDMVAISLINELKSHGIRVPEDISVVGFDDLMISSLISPPLTTIKTDYAELAQTALHMLIRLVNQPSSCAKRSNVAVKLITRQSVKCVSE